MWGGIGAGSPNHWNALMTDYCMTAKFGTGKAGSGDTQPRSLAPKRDYGKVGVLMGGKSTEREISLKSGTAVLHALLRCGVNAHAFDPGERGLNELVAQKFDRVFIALHGRFGEDGTIQGALEWLGIPYSGSGVMASAVAMDKWRTKLIWQSAGIPTPRFIVLERDFSFATITQYLGLPVVVKPAREGSSIGVSKVNTMEETKKAYEVASRYDDIVLAEQFISGSEITAAILGETALPLIRLETPREFYDYEAKYLANSTRYLCPSGLGAETEKSIQEFALRAFRILGCKGWGRCDVMLDRENNPYFLEVNTIPGMTDHSLVPMAAKAYGLSFDDLVLEILELAYVG
jgi:D-alanine-D-alanine ligase